jgi:alkyl hydroperoxide reductase subunit AhpC
MMATIGAVITKVEQGGVTIELLSFPALLDHQGTIRNLYRVTVPESFIINREGIVEKVVIARSTGRPPRRFVSSESNY